MAEGQQQRAWTPAEIALAIKKSKDRYRQRYQVVQGRGGKRKIAVPSGYHIRTGGGQPSKMVKATGPIVMNKMKSRGHGASPAGRQRREIRNQQRDIKNQQRAIKRGKNLALDLDVEKVKKGKSKKFFRSRRSWESISDWKTRQQREDEAAVLAAFGKFFGKRP